jgi:hypothetical protein
MVMIKFSLFNDLSVIVFPYPPEEPHLRFSQVFDCLYLATSLCSQLQTGIITFLTGQGIHWAIDLRCHHTPDTLDILPIPTLAQFPYLSGSVAGLHLPVFKNIACWAILC